MKKILLNLTVLFLFTLLNFISLNAQWQQCNNGMNGISVIGVRNIALSGNDIFILSDYDLFLSKNNGDTWQNISPKISYNSVGTIAATENYLYASGFDGIYTSSDKGENWIETLASYNSIYSLAADSNFVIAGIENSGVYISTDNGSSWQGVNIGLPNSSVDSPGNKW